MSESAEKSEEISFGPFRLDRANVRLTRDGRTVPLTPKSFDVLHFLASRFDRLVSKEQLLASVWSDVIVGDASVKVCIREIRAALGDGIKAPKYIETVHRKGYRFIGKPGEPGETFPPPAPAERPGERADRVVGREGELARLLAVFDEVGSGQRRCLFVAGGAGAGKTALLEAFAEGVEGRCIFLKGHCFEQFGVTEPYMPVWEALAKLPQGMSSPSETLLARHAAVRGDPAREPGGISEPRISSERLLRELLSAIERLSATQTVVLLLEDLHWADFSTLDLVTALARRRSPARLLIVATYRREGITEGHPLRTVFRGLAAASLCSELALGLLDIAGVEAFLGARFPGQAFPPGFAPRLLQRTNGHPLFLVHLTNDLATAGLLPGGEDGARGPDAGWLAALDTRIPWTVRAMIEGDFERLPEDRREVLQAAAVAGIDFSAASIAAILGLTPIQADETCDELVRLHRFLEPRGLAEWPDGMVAGRYRFAHEMYHNVVYERLPPARRMRMHQALGQRLEAAWGEQAGEEAAVLATHFELGRDWGRAVKYLRHSAAAATHEHAHREALQSFRRAKAALDHLPPEERDVHELDLLLALAVNLRVTEGCGAAEVREVHERAYALCQALGNDVARSFPILWGVWVFHKVRSDLDLAQTMAGQLLAVARSVGDTAMEMQARQAVSVTALCMGRPEVTVEQMDQAALIYDAQQHAANAERFGQDPGVATMSFGSIAPALLGRWEEAASARNKALVLATGLNQPSSIALASFFAAMLSQFEGDPRAAARWATKTIVLSEEEGYSFWLAGSHILAGWARIATGWAGGAEAESGIEEIREGLAAWHATGSRTYLTYYLSLLADALLRLGRAEEALAAIEEALALIEPLSERMVESRLREAHERCLGALPRKRPTPA